MSCSAELQFLVVIAWQKMRGAGFHALSSA